MARSYGRSFLFHRQDARRCLLLAAACFAGLVLGILWGSHTGIISDSWMLGALTSPLSIPGLTAILLVPFLLIALAIFYSRLWLLCLTLVMKMFCFGACGWALTAFFGSAGWLVRFLLMFSDSMMLPMLCFLALRRCTGRLSRGDFLLGVGWMVLVGALDFWLVSPFLATLG